METRKPFSQDLNDHFTQGFRGRVYCTQSPLTIGNPMHSDLDTLDLEEAAAYLKLGVEHTRTLFNSGQIPGLSLNQKHIVFLRRDLADFIREHARNQMMARAIGFRRRDKSATLTAVPKLKAAPEPTRGTGSGMFDLSQYG